MDSFWTGRRDLTEIGRFRTGPPHSAAESPPLTAEGHSRKGPESQGRTGGKPRRNALPPRTGEIGFFDIRAKLLRTEAPALSPDPRRRPATARDRVGAGWRSGGPGDQSARAGGAVASTAVNGSRMR